MSKEEVADETFRPTFCEQKKIVAVLTRLMTRQEEENGKLPSRDKLPTVENDFKQPEKPARNVRKKA
uniref:Uncharacterized protein n=1 Tax=Romanomermis culicivorax TaxID=13658 RepID=A0A915KDG1_ROMCU